MADKLPHRWSLGHNPLSGLTLGRWLGLLRDNGFGVDAAYAHRAVFLTAMSAFNSLCHAAERLRHGWAVGRMGVRTDPVFILGHWRSGTTHLHNLLALDDRLAFATTFECVNPSSFLTTGRVLPRLFGPLLPARRPMDNMAMSFDAPNEDELALALLSGLSPYLSLSFPRAAERYDRYLTFEGVGERDVGRWKAAWGQFARKLALRDGRRFVFKSPAHTGRVRLLLELFPDARFVHVHRDPYAVFQSSRRYFHTAAWHANLQAHGAGGFDGAILRRYGDLYGAYLDQRGLIPPGRLHELAYGALEADPVGELRRVYEALDLGPFDPAEPAVRGYLDSIGGYRKNEHAPLSGAERRRIASAWGRFFEAFGYPTGFERGSGRGAAVLPAPRPEGVHA